MKNATLKTFLFSTNKWSIHGFEQRSNVIKETFVRDLWVYFGVQGRFGGGQTQEVQGKMCQMNQVL